MKSREYYRGREQTYLKHFFLERYLERVAYNILSHSNDFVYVDGFSGPWKSEDEAYQDTSFVIALQTLRQVRDGLRKRGRTVKIRCLFVEKDPISFQGLDNAVNAIRDLDIRIIHGEFESAIPDILQFIGTSFSLIFIDPSGWTGFGLDKIEPLLKLRGEVLVNFMYDDISRHLEDVRPEILASYEPLFGGPGWEDEVEDLIRHGKTREEAILEVYRERLRSAGQFPYVTSTRILKPLADRSYYHLVYSTRHWKGLVEFRKVEKQAVHEQERVRDAAKQDHRIERTGQPELFGPETLPGTPRSFTEMRYEQCHSARARLIQLLTESPRLKYEQILGILLESSLVWQSDINQWIMDMHKAGDIDIEGLKKRERTPKPSYVIVRKR